LTMSRLALFCLLCIIALASARNIKKQIVKQAATRSRTRTREFESCAPPGLNVGTCATDAECPVSTGYELVASDKCTEEGTKCCQISASKSDFDCGMTETGGGKCMTDEECKALPIDKAPSSDAACADAAKPVCCLLTNGYYENDGYTANLLIAFNAAPAPAAGGDNTAVAASGTPPPASGESTLLQSRSRLSRAERTKKNLKTLRSLRQTQTVKGCDAPKCADNSDPVAGAGAPPSANGCGPEGASDWVLKALAHPVLNPCCNDHDICYGTIGTPHPTCDATFFSCMTTRCQTTGLNWFLRFGCYEVSTVYWAAVRAGGCSAWQEAQKKSGCAEGKVAAADATAAPPGDASAAAAAPVPADAGAPA